MSNTTLKLEGKAWSTFLDVELAPQTKQLYGRWVQNFMEYCKVKNPDKLLELGSGKKAVQQIEDKVIAWLGALKDSGKATATMRTALACVVFFYSCNRIKVDGKFIARRIPKKPALPHRSPTKEEVAAIIEAASLRCKALVGTLASTGVRLGAIPPLKLRHRRTVKPEELEHLDCSCKDRSQALRFNGYLLNVYEGEEEGYFTFISEESSKWLDTYAKMRANAGETLGPNSPLFREEFDLEKSDSVEHPSSCKENGLQSVLSRLAISAGKKPIVKKDKKIHQGAHRNEWKNVHGYRMFFSTAATNAGVNFSFKELMLGHHLNLEKSYYDSNNPRSVHAALAEYLKMQDAVTLFSTSRLERDNAVLREQNSQITNLQDVITTLSDRLAEVERQAKKP
jgi:integrase